MEATSQREMLMQEEKTCTEARGSTSNLINVSPDDHEDSSLPIDPASQTDAPKIAGKNKFVEGLLELGRNWAVAVAVAAFGTASYHGEAVTGTWQNKDLVLGTTAGFSILWIALSILRFLDVAEAPTKGVRQALKAWCAVIILVAFGAALVLQTASYADNAKIVRICNDYRSLPESAAYKDALCQKLYKDRTDKERTYMGKE